MDEVRKHALIETIKSIARGLYFAILGLIAAALTAFATSGAVKDVSIELAGIPINLSFIVVAVVGFIVKAIDTYVHKNDYIEINGIAPSFLQK